MKALKVRFTFACGGTLDSMPLPLDVPWALACPACADETEAAFKVVKVEIVEEDWDEEGEEGVDEIELTEGDFFELDCQRYGGDWEATHGPWRRS